jgi:hypothetical protein
MTGEMGGRGGRCCLLGVRRSLSGDRAKTQETVLSVFALVTLSLATTQSVDIAGLGQNAINSGEYEQNSI